VRDPPGPPERREGASATTRAASVRTDVKEAGSSSLLVTRGGELAEAPGGWSGIEG
jgi:hypothetical protein